MMVYRSVIYFRRTILSGLHKMRSNLIIKNSGPLGKHGSEINAFFTLPPCRKRYLGGKTGSSMRNGLQPQPDRLDAL